MGQHMQIGEVAERTKLSLRTIRHYEEVGLVPPSARSKGGFRLYTESDVQRLLLIRRMKPLDFTLDEMADLLDLLDNLAAEDHPADRAGLLDRLTRYHEAAGQRINALREQLDTAMNFANQLQQHLDQHTHQPR
ncbi:DNA-binding transcriptional MerR regulator [Kribbella sp. VKM Ac-2527]|uniref:DNA-binding transcriptional MerR regulator n=1 Tax=Kribbella caucasensis TaxID=2512215 RepID=A0A4R6J4V5_9ACTN|nr:MerR family transcriptional regulator [Kribbella sp. VKM Ac-2527]TDO29851.1 DNA-binding transcriptional MerR regulator [Kribbella sp. VKM Ac-2527]